MNRTSPLRRAPAALFYFGALAFSPLAADEPPRPNVLVIMADDLGFSDLGCYGGEIATPHLDSVAENGLLFSRFYNTGRCWPTRGSLLTGFYAQQIRRDALPDIPSGGGNNGIRPEWAVLLPELLRPAGYRSYHTGKWHLDGMPVAGGFDRSYYLRDQGRFFNPIRHRKDDEPLPPVEKDSGFYGTVALADHAIEVLEEHAAEHAGTPFFHYLAFAAPHFPLHALPEDIEIYADTYLDGWDAIRARRWQRIQDLGFLDPVAVKRPSPFERHVGAPYYFPDAYEVLGENEVNHPLPWNRLTPGQQEFQSTKMALHAAMIHRMDLEIGRVFAQIKKMEEWDNTLVMFLSDNGASAEIMVRDDGHDSSLPPGAADTYLCLGAGWSTVCNTPFRRHKTWTHEGGTATPLVVSWPRGIEARGEVRHHIGHVIDIVPTLLELAGADAFPKAPESPGKSLVPVFAGDEDAPEHEWLWWFHDGHRAVLKDGWKAVSVKNQPWELYHLEEDRIESIDLAIVEPERLATLVAEWENQLEESIRLASADLSEAELEKAKGSMDRPGRMMEAMDAAQPLTNQVLPRGETFLLAGRRAFLLSPAQPSGTTGKKPWIFYGPTLRQYPDEAETWMHERFLDAGVAVAGIDVGEAYGSPHAFPYFEKLYAEMISRGYSEKPAVLARSRGGLWAASWAIAHPERVAGIGGIYPVFDFTSYPGLLRAAPAYGLAAEELGDREDELNPVKRVDVLAKAGVPIFIIHGREDKLVPLADNSEAVERVYESAGVGDLIEVMKMEGQGHSFWPGFFRCEELVEFLVRAAGVEER